MSMSSTPLTRFVVDLLYNKLYRTTDPQHPRQVHNLFNKSTTNRISGVWALPVGELRSVPTVGGQTGLGRAVKHGVSVVTARRNKILDSSFRPGPLSGTGWRVVAGAGESSSPGR